MYPLILATAVCRHHFGNGGLTSGHTSITFETAFVQLTIYLCTSISFGPHLDKSVGCVLSSLHPGNWVQNHLIYGRRAETPPRRLYISLSLVKCIVQAFVFVSLACGWGCVAETILGKDSNAEPAVHPAYHRVRVYKAANATITVAAIFCTESMRCSAA